MKTLLVASHWAIARTVTFVGNENLQPYAFTEGGAPQGIAVELARAALDASGLDAEIELRDWNLAQQQMTQGSIDGLIHINPNPERKKTLIFSDPLLRTEFVIFSRTGEGARANLSHFENKVVGVEKKGYPYLLLEQNPLIQRHLVTDWFNAFNDLSTGKLDAIIVDRWVGEYQLTQMSLSNVKALEPALSISESRIAVARDRPDLLAAINRGLAEISTNGSRETIEQHWKDQEVVYFSRDQLQQQRILMLTAALAFLLMFTLLYILRQYRTGKRLSQLNDALLQSNQELDEFARVASHDLQEPLRQLLLRLELFELEKDESPTEARQHLSATKNAALRMQHRITTMLRYSRVDSRSLNPQPTDIYQLFQTNWLDLANKTEAIMQLPDRIPYWNVDSVLFDRLVQNILSNALKYQSPDRSLKVTVTYKKNAKTSELHITDNGRGMPSNLADQAFTLFTRLDPNSAPGNGLGLAICRKIIRLHKGEINVSSAQGEGTRFTLSLPSNIEVNP